MRNKKFHFSANNSFCIQSGVGERSLLLSDFLPKCRVKHRECRKKRGVWSIKKLSIATLYVCLKIKLNELAINSGNLQRRFDIDMRK